MRAVTIHAPNDLRIDDVSAPEPGSPEFGPRDVKVRIGVGGICGSDLHYFQHGGFGAVRIREPMILGHEISGTVAAIGTEVSRVKVGDRIAVNPSVPCWGCVYCLEGKPNHCLDMRFYGSAMRFPHVQGAFREVLVAREEQCFVVPQSVDLTTAAFAEPLSVCLHAVKRAGPMIGKKVLVTGTGPIGALAVAAARRAGAQDIVATDVMDEPLEAAKKVGADQVINVAKSPERLEAYAANKGTFDIQIEASGNDRAIMAGLNTLRPGGILVQLGIGGDVALPISMIVAREIEIRGSFRFHEEFAWAVEFLSRGLIDTAPLLTDVISIDRAQQAFELAGDRTRAMKVQLSFE
jgi:L-idonate 5-dehydrogenase